MPLFAVGSKNDYVLASNKQCLQLALQRTCKGAKVKFPIWVLNTELCGIQEHHQVAYNS